MSPRPGFPVRRAAVSRLGSQVSDTIPVATTATTPPSGGPSGDALQLETGDYLLLETGDYLLKE